MRQAARGAIQSSHHELGGSWLYCDGNPELLFTENETNARRLWGQPSASTYVKDAFHSYLIAGDSSAMNPNRVGTKAAAHYALEVPGGGTKTIRLRLAATPARDVFGNFEATFEKRIYDANEFYDRITPQCFSEDQRRVHRQALSGILWSKQYYYFDLEHWLSEHKSLPLIGSDLGQTRNTEWFHMLNADVISMPGKWEYPWYAAWDLAFHTLSASLVDFDFAKEQLLLMLRSLYLHPNRQIPAYKWNFSYAMDRIGAHHENMWDEQDGFFYDVLRSPSGQATHLKVRSMVGLLPLCASTIFEANAETRYPKLMEMIALFKKRHPELVSRIAPTEDGFARYKGRRLFSLVNKAKLERVLSCVLDENEFLGPVRNSFAIVLSPRSSLLVLGGQSGI